MSTDGSGPCFTCQTPFSPYGCSWLHCLCIGDSFPIGALQTIMAGRRLVCSIAPNPWPAIISWGSRAEVAHIQWSQASWRVVLWWMQCRCAGGLCSVLLVWNLLGGPHESGYIYLLPQSSPLAWCVAQQLHAPSRPGFVASHSGQRSVRSLLYWKNMSILKKKTRQKTNKQTNIYRYIIKLHIHKVRLACENEIVKCIEIQCLQQHPKYGRSARRHGCRNGRKYWTWEWWKCSED